MDNQRKFSSKTSALQTDVQAQSCHHVIIMSASCHHDVIMMSSCQHHVNIVSKNSSRAGVVEKRKRFGTREFNGVKTFSCAKPCVFSGKVASGVTE